MALSYITLTLFLRSWCAVSPWNRVHKSRTPGRHGDRIKLHTWAPNIYRSSIWNFLLVTFLASRILRCFLDVWTYCAPLSGMIRRTNLSRPIRKEIYSISTSSTTNSTWIAMASNPCSAVKGRRSLWHGQWKTEHWCASHTHYPPLSKEQRPEDWDSRDPV